MAKRVLVLAYGNPGRLDDGLGPAAARRLAAADLPEVTVECDYQLQVEDAAAIAEHDVVLFVDASVNGPAPFSLHRVEPKADLSFTSHSVSPQALLAMARDHFGASTEGYGLGIRGYAFDGFGEQLTPEAQRNLCAAVEHLVRSLGKHPSHLTDAGAARETAGARRA